MPYDDVLSPQCMMVLEYMHKEQGLDKYQLNDQKISYGEFRSQKDAVSDSIGIAGYETTSF